MLNPKLIHTAAVTALILSTAAMAQVYVTTWLLLKTVFNGITSGCIILHVKVMPSRHENLDLGTMLHVFLTEPIAQHGNSGGPATSTNACYLSNTPVRMGDILCC